MYFDEECYMKLEDMMMRNIVRDSSSRSSLPGSHDNSTLDFVSHGNYQTHPVNTYCTYRT